jgi:hypothetical protein
MGQFVGTWPLDANSDQFCHIGRVVVAYGKQDKPKETTVQMQEIKGSNCRSSETFEDSIVKSFDQGK